MTRTTNPTATTHTPMTATAVRRLLRDAALVLHWTSRVKAEIIAERPEAASRRGRRRTPELAAGLVV
jgi:hypothetical protein